MSRALFAAVAFVAGFCTGWYRREDPFVKGYYGYEPAREPWDIYS